MSGGAWEYQQFKIEEEALRLGELLRLIAQIEHELDWGVSGDTCLYCAHRRVGVAFEQYFGDGRNDATAAVAIAKDDGQSKCERHSHSH